MSDSAPARWLGWIVVLAASIPYLPTINDYFTQDDFGVIQLLSNRPWTIFPRWFAMPWTENIWGYTPDEIRPFVALTYQVTAIPGAARPELHHILNIAIHAANALLVMAIARTAIGLTPIAAAFAGIVFGVLPLQAESVAWITGRVDSMPAFFYLSTFLAYVLWRRRADTPFTTGRRSMTAFPAFWYLVGLALFFIALFSKQNTITMVATLAAYDLVILDRARRGTLLSCVKAWLPFALMTLGYLALRRALFGASMRGGVESGSQIIESIRMIGRHFLRTAFGHVTPPAQWETYAAIGIAATLAVFLFRHRRFVRATVCFGFAWWIIGAAPVLLAGYESPRHVYLASAAWAFMLALFFEAYHKDARTRSSQALRAAPYAIAAVIACTYVVRLQAVVDTWGTLSRISQSAVRRTAREAAASPPGTLLLVGVPQKSWEWGAPFVLQPPYTTADLSQRVRLVTPFRLHCCGPQQWEVYTRQTLQTWLQTPGSPPVVALHFAPETGAASRLTEAENPDLRLLLAIVAKADSWQAMDDAILKMLEELVRK